jgi:hypothetical protein
MSKRQTILLSAVVAAAIVIVAAAAYTVGVAAGRSSAVASVSRAPAAQQTGARMAQDPFFQPQMPQVAPPAQIPQQGPAPVPQAPAPGGPPQLREFVPLPGPGDQQPGQRPGQQQGDCEPIILFYHNGKLYQLKPGPGQQNGPGRPTQPPEFYQLNPYQGPPVPGLPAPVPPQGPGFAPVNPRS